MSIKQKYVKPVADGILLSDDSFLSIPLKNASAPASGGQDYRPARPARNSSSADN